MIDVVRNTIYVVLMLTLIFGGVTVYFQVSLDRNIIY